MARHFDMVIVLNIDIFWINDIP